MGLMFVSFLLQNAFRYVLNQPLGWTEEVNVRFWVWVVLWCAAFVLSDPEEIRFDIVYGLLSPRSRRICTAISSIALVVLLLIALPATFQYVTFMKRDHTAYLRMRFDWLYVIYLIFAVACSVKLVQIAWRAIRGAPPEAGAMTDNAA
jgi:TRAP-type C4-dicarboxylate transport system permease small subunit